MLDLAERQSSRWGDLGIRVLSALVLTPVALACVWFGGIAFTLCIAVVVLGLVVEWMSLCGRLSAFFGRARDADVDGRATPGHRAAALPFGWFSAGLLYVAAAGGALLWLRADPVSGRSDVLFVLLIVWSGDIGAYVVGRWWGGPRLAPSISPGKTWSGAIGGLLAAVVAGLLAAHFLAQPITVWWVAAIAIVLSIVAQGGDLLESFVKRRLAVKDSGNLIPGHGGLFDRLDGVLAAAPVAALLALILGRGVVLWQ